MKDIRHTLRLKIACKTKRLANGCLVWTGNFTAKGYGTFMFQYKNIRAHRAAWFVEHGMWPTLFVCHSCDNKACVEPSHLFEGTAQDNMDDLLAKGFRTGRVKGI